MSSLFKDKLVLITGAAHGIGRTILTDFIRHGAELIIVDIDQAALQKLEHTLQSTPLKFVTLHCDVTQEEQVKKQFHLAEERMGKDVDILVNVAGGAHCDLLRDSTAALFRQDLELNLLAAYHCVEALRPGFIKKRSGIIINIGTVNSMSTLGHPCYSAAKAALESYTKALAVEFGQYGIRANLISPASVKTRLWEDRLAKNPEVFEKIKQWYPFGDIATPEDIAEAVCFLASDAAKMISGVNLPVDGGLMAGTPAMIEAFTQKQL